jgi:hypothetical protein
LLNKLGRLQDSFRNMMRNVAVRRIKVKRLLLLRREKQRPFVQKQGSLSGSGSCQFARKPRHSRHGGVVVVARGVLRMWMMMWIDLSLPSTKSAYGGRSPYVGKCDIGSVVCTQASPLWLFGGRIIHLNLHPQNRKKLQQVGTARDPNFVTCSASASRFGSANG